MTRLAVVTTHPVQYYAPWFRHVAACAGIDLRVFYLWDSGVVASRDRAFWQTFAWDVPLLDGYEAEFVRNVSSDPGTHHFAGIDNPDLPARLDLFRPHAVLCIGYNFRSFQHLFSGRGRRHEPLILRGDSHRLVPATGVRARAKAFVLRRVFRRFAAFLYVGAANRDYYLLHGVPDGKLVFAPHAVDNDRFAGARPAAEIEAAEWKRSLGVPDSRAVALFAGKFEPKKRPCDLLAAYRRADVPRSALLFVGSGPLEASLRREAAGAADVFFAPFQNQSQMPRTYAAGDVLVLPSLGPSETWGLCVNEAMCLGRPAIVSTHVGCAQDLVTDGETGLVFPAGNADRLAGALRHALSDADARKRWGEAAAVRVAAYNYEAATRGLVECLRRVVPAGTAR